MSAANPLPASAADAARSYEPSMEEILASIRRIIADDQTLPQRSAVPSAVVPPADVPSEVPATPEAFDPPGAPVPFPTPEPFLVAPEPHPAAHGSVDAPQFPSQGGYVEAAAPPPIPTHAPAPPAAEDVQPPYVARQPEAPPQPEPEPSVEELVRDEVFESFPAADDPLAHEAFGPESIETAADHPGEPLDHHEVAAETADEDDYDTPIEPEPAIDPRAPSEPAALFSPATDTAVASAFNMLAASRLADNSDELMNLAREMIRPLLRTWIDDNLPSMVERMVRAEIERVARGGR